VKKLGYKSWLFQLYHFNFILSMNMSGLAREGLEEVVLIPLCVQLPDGLHEVQIHLNLREVAAEDGWEMMRTQCRNILDMLRTEENEGEEQQQQPQDWRDQDWRQPQDLVQDWTWADRDGNPDPPRGPPSDWSDNEEDRVPIILDRDWYDWDSEVHRSEEEKDRQEREEDEEDHLDR
jgi:hypothetical protein